MNKQKIEIYQSLYYSHFIFNSTKKNYLDYLKKIKKKYLISRLTLN